MRRGILVAVKDELGAAFERAAVDGAAVGEEAGGDQLGAALEGVVVDERDVLADLHLFQCRAAAQRARRDHPDTVSEREERGARALTGVKDIAQTHHPVGLALQPCGVVQRVFAEIGRRS